MPITHRKKSRKMQANRTRGYGTIGAHRAKGVRGGTGLTTGKFKHKWTYYLKMRAEGFPGPDGDKWRIGYTGFKRPQKMLRIYAVNAINIKEVELNLDQWLEDGKVEKKGTKYIIDLKSLHYNKLLGSGNVTKPMEITVEKASKKAIEKLKAAKVKLTLTATKE
ncbi:uL15m family ribosomal protein [Promethearchaeum syntrophicum]|uniref:Large ribosomal subunit protein uL15 n=1 Tax=Promethearchaeum syntrophicum TaxID=2594042 RepID=A0A5B9D884_9ARCH|nr:uL15 family ribosomal protein [Candidatus Prometheoarchaeum syntrophicum]QEE15344.1 50S ribosomal protein L15P [Candidatus Prometheoarchaeum syntrophicum]